jgi:hypothetical protein
MTEKVKDKEKRLDEAVDMTFPGSDPVAAGKATGTEPPKRPADRKAPIISKEEIERARRSQSQRSDR